jgi:hypothetical protein
MAPPAEATYWFRPTPAVQADAAGESAAEKATEKDAARPADGRWDDELAPYRREVTRLRGVLESWQRDE